MRSMIRKMKHRVDNITRSRVHLVIRTGSSDFHADLLGFSAPVNSLLGNRILFDCFIRDPVIILL